jgi:flagellar basal body rod protein FlgG
MAFQQGLSGLSMSSKALDAVGNNIANSGTVGFKGAGAQTLRVEPNRFPDQVFPLGDVSLPEESQSQQLVGVVVMGI